MNWGTLIGAAVVPGIIGVIWFACTFPAVFGLLTLAVIIAFCAFVGTDFYNFSTRSE